MVFFFCSMSKLDCEFQVLNETSLWWFNQTQHITQNAVVSAPDKNVTIAKKCSVFPVEFVGELYVGCEFYLSLLCIYLFYFPVLRLEARIICISRRAKSDSTSYFTPSFQVALHGCTVTLFEFISLGHMTLDIFGMLYFTSIQHGNLQSYMYI